MSMTPEVKNYSLLHGRLLVWPPNSAASLEALSALSNCEPTWQDLICGMIRFASRPAPHIWQQGDNREGLPWGIIVLNHSGFDSFAAVLDLLPFQNLPVASNDNAAATMTPIM